MRANNGIATEVAALRLFVRTYAGCVMPPATHLEPGVVVARRSPRPPSALAHDGGAPRSLGPTELPICLGPLSSGA